MAKQVLVNSNKLMLPEWKKECRQRDISGVDHGFVEHWPERQWHYTQAREEVWHEGIRPDVLLSDASSQLLVEIKVSHAVDEPKAHLVRQSGWAMVEVDLSQVPETALLQEAFINYLLNRAPRTWVHAPKAQLRYEDKRKALRVQVAAIDAELKRRGVVERDEFGRTQADRLRQRRIDNLRVERRKPFLNDIEELGRKALPNALLQQEAQRRAQEADQIAAYVAHHGGSVPAFAKTAHKDAWVVKASTGHWQLAVFEHFVRDAKEGTRLTSGTVCRWVEEKFGIDETAARLNEVLRDDRERRKRRGDTGLDLARGAWFFDEWENRLVPSLFHAVDALLERLVIHDNLLANGRWSYRVNGPHAKEIKRLAAERLQAKVEEKREEEMLAEQERQHQLALQMAGYEKTRVQRLAGLQAAYEALAHDEDECLDCHRCRWPRALIVPICDNCGAESSNRVLLDANRLRELPHRLRCDAGVMSCIKYPFE